MESPRHGPSGCGCLFFLIVLVLAYVSPLLGLLVWLAYTVLSFLVSTPVGITHQDVLKVLSPLIWKTIDDISIDLENLEKVFKLQELEVILQALEDKKRVVSQLFPLEPAEFDDNGNKKTERRYRLTTRGNETKYKSKEKPVLSFLPVFDS